MTAWFRRVRSIYRRTAEIAISWFGVALVISIAFVTVDREQVPPWWLIAVAVATAVLHYLVRIWATGREPAEPGAADAPEWTVEEISSGIEILFFARALARPNKTFTRIKETVTPLTRAHDVKSRYWLDVPVGAARMETVRVPVLVPRKGTLYDDMRITNADGAELPTLSFPQSAQYCLSIIHEIAVSLDEDKYRRYLSEFETALASYVFGYPQLDKEASKDWLLERERWLGKLQGSLGESAEAALVVQMASLLISSYVIVACVPVGSNWQPAVLADSVDVDQPPFYRQLVIDTSHRHVLPSKKSSGWWLSWVVDLLARATGLRPLAFEYPMDRAAQAQSYHLEFFGPDGTYLFRQGFPKRFLSKHFSYHIFRRRLGQRYAHLYCRGASDHVRGQKVRFTYRERPPGSLGTAAATAIGAFIVIALAAAHFSGGGSDDTDGIFSLLLAFPAVTAAWLGMDRPSMLFGGSPVARLANIVTLLVSTLAVVCSLGLHADGPIAVLLRTATRIAVQVFPEWLVSAILQARILEIDPAWTVLVVFSGCTAILLIYLWLSEAFMYTRFVRRATSGLDATGDELA